MKTLVLMLILLAVMPARSQKLSDITPEIAKMLSAVDGRFAVGVYDLQRHDQLFLNPDTVFHAASTMKTPVMIELFRQVEAGKLRLEEEITVTNEFKSIVDGSPYLLDAGDDSDSVLYQQLGSRKSIRELIRFMITVSSNLATNILIERVGAKNVMETMKSIGANDIRVLRGVEDIKAYRQGLNNQVTARDLVTVFKSLAEGSLTRQASTDEMLNILSEQKFRAIIPALLPPGTRIAHKTGSIGGVEHDSGIVFLPNGRSYVIVLLSKDLSDADAGKRELAKVSKRIFDYFTSAD